MTRSTEPIAVGIVGFGKIARDQHVAAIEASPRLVLSCVADADADAAATPAPVRCYPSIESMLAAGDAPQAVAICTPPQVRYRVARHALERGKHVLLEKPPATTLGELEDLRALARNRGATLFCAWHSQFAPAVAPARDWLATRQVKRVRIDWREDVRVWHPGQRWIFEPGGFGVFDPGINALSIASKILPKQPFMRDAVLWVPENCATPIAAELTLTDADATPMTASFDFLKTGPQTWEIEVETDGGRLLIAEGGGRLALDGRNVQLGPNAEYPALYARFADLIATAQSDADAVPLQLVADAFLRGRRETVPAFADPAATTAAPAQRS